MFIWILVFGDSLMYEIIYEFLYAIDSPGIVFGYWALDLLIMEIIEEPVRSSQNYVSW